MVVTVDQQIKKGCLVFFINEPEDHCRFYFENEITDDMRNNIRKIDTYNIEMYMDDFMECENGYIELDECLFYINFEERKLEIIKWYTEDKQLQNMLINEITDFFESQEEEEDEERRHWCAYPDCSNFSKRNCICEVQKNENN